MHQLMRPVTEKDSDVCGCICYNAFAAFGAQRHSTPEIPDVSAARSLIRGLVGRPDYELLS
ncbi:hypothetical protein PCAR4_290023 [Paraburkholderia caribensis]|nr:hypothetical protein PCAR4_290023 [Paraburkholderia caribensis]